MPLVFSPLSEDVLGPAPVQLFPKLAFVARQLGGPPADDQEIFEATRVVLGDFGISVMDADSSSGRMDFLERVLGLIRGTGFTIAVFSQETRRTAFANIALELGFAAMCGKPLVIIKSSGAQAPSDLTRTDWIEYDQEQQDRFRTKLEQAVEEITALADFEEDKLEVALEADRMDCAIAFERIRKAFLLTGERAYIRHANTVLDRLREGTDIDDLTRQRDEVSTFVRQANRAVERQA